MGEYQVKEMHLSDLDLPSEAVAPGAPVEAQVTITNGAAFITPFDEDGCDAGSSRGYKTVTTLDVDGLETQTERQCVGIAAVGVNKVTHRFSFMAPEDTGDYSVTARLALEGSGLATAGMHDTFTVSESGGDVGDPDDEDDQDDAGGWTPPWMDNPNDGGGGLVPSLGSLDRLTTAVLIIAFLYALGTVIDYDVNGGA